MSIKILIKITDELTGKRIIKLYLKNFFVNLHATFDADYSL